MPQTVEMDAHIHMGIEILGQKVNRTVDAVLEEEQVTKTC
jgi:hypothetical protein